MPEAVERVGASDVTAARGVRVGSCGQDCAARAGNGGALKGTHGAGNGGGLKRAPRAGNGGAPKGTHGTGNGGALKGVLLTVWG
jgi:hypothetical protein